MNPTVETGGPEGPLQSRQTASRPQGAITALPAAMFTPPTQSKKVRVTLMAKVFISMKMKPENLQPAYQNLITALMKSTSAMADRIKSKAAIEVFHSGYNPQNGVLKVTLNVPKTVEKAITDSMDSSNLLELPTFGNVAVGLGNKEYTSRVTITKVPHWWNEDHLKMALKAKNLELLSAVKDTDQASGFKRCNEWLGQVSSNTELPDSGDLFFVPDSAGGTNGEVQEQEMGEILKLRVFRSSSIPEYLLAENPETEHGFTLSAYQRPVNQSSWKQGPSERVLQAPSPAPLKIMGVSEAKVSEETAGKSKNSLELLKNKAHVTVGAKKKKKVTTAKTRAEAQKAAAKELAKTGGTANGNADSKPAGQQRDEIEEDAAAIAAAAAAAAAAKNGPPGQRKEGNDRGAGNNGGKNGSSGQGSALNNTGQQEGVKTRARSQTQQEGGASDAQGEAGTVDAGGGDGSAGGSGTGMNDDSGQREAAILWRELGYGIVLVQETRVHTANPLAQYQKEQLDNYFRKQNWTPYFAPNQDQGGGVAIFIDTSLLTAGLKVKSVQYGEDSKRALKMTISWSQLEFDIICVYFPVVSQTQLQQAFLNDTLLPLYDSDKPTIIGGDYNFVFNRQLDRNSRENGKNGDGIWRQWQQKLGHLRDTFRAFHPRQRTFSFFHRNNQWASRIDRLHACPRMMEYVYSSNVSTSPGPSDHQPIYLRMVGKGVPTRGPARKRIRTAFFKNEDLDTLFREGAQNLANEAPTEMNALLDWAPRAWKRVANLGCRLHAAARAKSKEAVASVERDLDKLRQEIEKEYTSSKLTQMMNLRKQWQTCYSNACSHVDLSNKRRDALHWGERLTVGRRRAMQPPPLPIPGLVDQQGTLRTGPAAAKVAAKHYARVSAQPEICENAQDTVIAAVREGKRLPEPLAEQLGALVFSADEVHDAIKATPSGKAPGADGIPAEIYKRYSDIFSPLLARIYTAIATIGRTPTGFLEGLIVLIHKGGDRTKAKQYRPITLLNTSYRIFAKALVGRLGPCLDEVVSPEQTAFIRSRNIGDSIMLLQSLPRLMQRDRIAGWAVFCDFEKAYDTIDRKFLFKVLEELGLGPGFIKMVKILLPEKTFSRATVNGFKSPLEAFYAGVRQGCPLAPLLYLCIGEALLRYLKKSNIGILVRGKTFTASQFADDTKALLPNAASLIIFLAAMNIFQKASGQKLNREKTKALPVGLRREVPQTIKGLDVVNEISSLGVTYQAFSGDPKPDWNNKINNVKHTYNAISRWQLTSFGRAHAAGTYGISKMLHHAEFSGPPPKEVIIELERFTAKLVDRGQAPIDTKLKPAGVRADLLVGKPSQGGFGAFPWESHIKARHALIGLNSLVGDTSNPWIFVTAELLRDVGLTPASALWDKTERGDSRVRQLGGHLAHCLQALRELPSPKLISAPPPGEWCLDAPIWGHIPHFSVCGVPLEALLQSALKNSLISTVGDAMVAYSTAVWTASSGNLVAYQQEFMQRYIRRPGMPTTLELELPGTVIQSLLMLQNRLPAHYRQAAAATLQQRQENGEWFYIDPSVERQVLGHQTIVELLSSSPQVAQAMAVPLLRHRVSAETLKVSQEVRRDRIRAATRVMLDACGWLQAHRPALRLQQLTVKAATGMYMKALEQRDRDVSEQRRLQLVQQQQQVQPEQQQNNLKPTKRCKHLDFVALAMGSDVCKSTAQGADAAANRMKKIFWQLSRVKWNNKFKEAYWRLVYNGIVVAERLQNGKACGACGAHRPGRLHHFWECPVAKALATSIATASGTAQLTCEQLWLITPPEGINEGVWEIVCLAAVTALNVARKLAFKRAYCGKPPLPQHSELTDSISFFAITHFWELIADFSAVCPKPLWLDRLTNQHPFLLKSDEGELSPNPPPLATSPIQSS